MTCTECGCNVITQRVWDAASAEQRAAWLQADTRKLQGRGRCFTCYQRLRRAGAIQPARRLTPKPHRTTCIRCGIGDTTGLCPTCRSVVRRLGELERWAS